MDGFTIEGWDDFVENFSKFVDKWADKKKILLQRMANIYHGEVIPHVPVDTSRLVDSITIFGEERAILVALDTMRIIQIFSFVRSITVHLTSQ